MRVVVFILLAVVLASLGLSKVNAISFASDHLENSTMILIAGDSKVYGIRLQNPSDSPVSVKIEYDNTFMKIINYKDVYNLPPKETGYSISFNVTAPKKPGIYNVGYTVMEVESGGGGGLPIRLKINKNFNLKVIKEPNKFYLNYDYVAYAVIILIFLLYIIKKKYAKKRTRQKNRKFL